MYGVVFLLVHGTTQSPDGWQLLINELNQAGHAAVTTDLARFGERLSAAQYGQAVAAELSGTNVDVVVAHSGSGLLLPAIASATAARLQVYLAAGIPNGERSLMEEVRDDALAVFNTDWVGTDPIADHDSARRFLFHDCTPEVADWAVTTLRSFVPVSVYSERVQPASAIPAMVVVPDRDRTLRTDWMLATARTRLGVEPVVLPGGHCPHVSRPKELASLLAGR
jgi:pimeloyl-ACP methyl ester carboxylesterase